MEYKEIMEQVKRELDFEKREKAIAERERAIAEREKAIEKIKEKTYKENGNEESFNFNFRGVRPKL